jgi:uncharacterized protein YndB with AHSA1/START domain
MTGTTDGATNTYRIWINATPDAIWQALIDPEQLARYGYGGRYDVELRPGGAYNARATDQMLEAGAPDLMVEGEVVEADARRRLELTWHPLFDENMTAEPPTRMTYEIEPGKDGVTKLTLTHDVTGAPGAAGITDGSVVEAGGGLPWVLSDLKTLLETGSTLPPQMG